MTTADCRNSPRDRVRWALPALLAGLLLALAGCSDDECLNCLDLPPPVVPTGVHSISGDNEVIVQWYDISYAPYDGLYSPNVERYFIYSRFFADGDEYDANRAFYYIGEVAWNENFDGATGLHWFVDAEAVNGERYEYAVAAVNAAGAESALSYELVTDAPLPIGLTPIQLYDGGGANAHLSGFDFSALEYGRTDPTVVGTTADIRVFFSDAVPYVQAVAPGVRLQDFGVFLDPYGLLVFEGVSWAPRDGYSSTGQLELIVGHIYVVEIAVAGGATHYAKFGVVSKDANSVRIIWAYQTIPGLQELTVPVAPAPRPGPQMVSF